MTDTTPNDHVCDFNSGPGSDQCGECGAFATITDAFRAGAAQKALNQPYIGVRKDAKGTTHIEKFSDEPEPQQFGQLERFPRTMPMNEVLAKGGRWLIESYLRWARSMGVDPLVGLATLQVFHTSASEAVGASHSDPLSQRQWPKVWDEQSIGWKVSIEFETPAVDALKEGVVPE